MGYYTGRNLSSESGPLLTHRAPLCVLQKCAPLGNHDVSRAHDGLPSSPQVPLFSAQADQPYTADPFSVLPNPIVLGPTSIPVLDLLHTACS